MTISTAGNNTNSNAMILGAYFICSHPQVYIRVVEKLQKNCPSVNDGTTYDETKTLPYLVYSILLSFLHQTKSIRGEN